jgi:hypothetical protein
MVIRHLNKGGATNALYRGGGSIGIIGAARMGLIVAPDPDDDQRRVLAVLKTNLAEFAPSLAYRVVTTASAPANESARGAGFVHCRVCSLCERRDARTASDASVRDDTRPLEASDANLDAPWDGEASCCT